MTTPNTLTPTAGAAGPTPAPQLLVPFSRAATRVNEPTELDRSEVLTSNSKLLGPIDVPARGFFRYLYVLVEATGGDDGNATVAAKEDAPWSVIQEISLTDVGGGQLIQPMTGYEMYLINLLGGYGYADNPTATPNYSAMDTNGNFKFALRVPVEIRARDGLGAIGNQDSSQTYKFNVTLSPSTDVYATAPDTLPTVRVRAWLGAWAVPPAANSLGQPNAVLPPAHGTVQNWTKETFNVSSGEQTVPIKRVGNLTRKLIFVFRNASGGARSTANLPPQLRLHWDAGDIFIEPKELRLDEMYRQHGVSAPTGVLVYNFDDEFIGKSGQELCDGYLPLGPTARFELKGVFGAAGTVTKLINDVLPAGDIYAS